MLFRHRSDTTITPDRLFEAKGPFEDSRIFKFLRIFDIFYRKSYSNENQGIFNGKSAYFHENLVKHFTVAPTLLPQGRLAPGGGYLAEFHSAPGQAYFGCP